MPKRQRKKEKKEKLRPERRRRSKNDKCADGLGRRLADVLGSMECPDVDKCTDGPGKRPAVVPGSYGKAPRKRTGSMPFKKNAKP